MNLKFYKFNKDRFTDDMRKIIFTNGKFYHIYNRGVEKRKIFLEDGDYLRFIHYLYELNDRDNLINFGYFFKNKFNKGGETSLIPRKRKLLIDVLCFCLMPNHFHLVLRQLTENGVSKFMQKLGTAWTMFFNTKYKRSGVLFQGNFKAVEIGQENQFLHISRYVHLNPLDLILADWQEKGINNWRKTNNFLEDYRWSSCLDYIGQKNFPSVINPEPLKVYFKTAKSYKNFISDWVAKDLKIIEDVSIE